MAWADSSEIVIFVNIAEGIDVMEAGNINILYWMISGLQIKHDAKYCN